MLGPGLGELYWTLGGVPWGVMGVKCTLTVTTEAGPSRA